MKTKNEEIKVIFLDVDGVLNCETTEDVIWRDKSKGGLRGIDDAKVELLKKIVDATSAMIVVSSTWRINKVKSIFADYIMCEDLSNEEINFAMAHNDSTSVYDYLRKKLAACDMCVYDDTPDLGIYCRGEEIYTWLENNPNVLQYVILDDEEFEDFSEYGLDDHILYTDYEYGLTEELAEKAIQILNGTR